MDGSRHAPFLLMARSQLLRSFGYQRFNHCYVWQQFLRQSMAFFQIRRAVIRNPHFPFAVFPNQELQRKIDCNAGSGQHKRCSRLRAPEDQQLGGAHFHPHFFCFSTVINESEQSDSLGLQEILQSIHRLLDGVMAWLLNDSFVNCFCGHTSLVNVFRTNDRGPAADHRAVTRWPVDFALFPATDRLESAFPFVTAFFPVTTRVVTLFFGGLDDTKGEAVPMSP